MKFRENSVQICLIVQLFITIVELHLVLRQPATLDFVENVISNPHIKSSYRTVLPIHSILYPAILTALVSLHVGFCYFQQS